MRRIVDVDVDVEGASNSKTEHAPRPTEVIGASASTVRTEMHIEITTASVDGERVRFS